MTVSLEGRIALVTGSSRGIGFQVAREFALNGATVILTSRKEENLIRAQKEIQSEGGEAFFIPAHFGKMEEIKSLMEKAITRFGRIDILVNNMGINPVHCPVYDLPFEIWEKMLNHNLTNYFYTSQLAAKNMIQNRYGKIINISSHSGEHPFRHFGAYSIVKSGINMLTRVFANELADFGINVNAIAPGYIETDFNKNRTDIQDKRKLREAIPIHRIGEPEDVASLALYLAGEESAYMTGEILTLDGGYNSLH
jgi:NAD(P)-dependent dehydrogenase (short-subunit alcohol dehydrogenase family)